MLKYMLRVKSLYLIETELKPCLQDMGLYSQVHVYYISEGEPRYTCP